MKQIKFLTTAFLIGLLFIGCDSDDSKKSNNSASGFSRIDFTIAGADRNGSFSIIDDLNTQEIFTNGTVYHSEEGEFVNFGYSDDIQEVNANFMILGGTGNHHYNAVSLEDDGFLYSFQLFFDTQTNMSNDNHFLTKNLSVTITEYQTENIAPGISYLNKIKGTFSGTIVNFNEVASGTYQNEHTIEGTFYYVMPNE